MHDIVQELVALIDVHDWAPDFDLAIERAQRHRIAAVNGIQDLGDNLALVDGLVT